MTYLFEFFIDGISFRLETKKDPVIVVCCITKKFVI